MLVFDTRNLPPDESLLIDSKVEEDIFQLPEGDEAKPCGPVSLKVDISMVTGNLLVRGRFSAPFELTCVRCGSSFVHTVDLAEHALIEPLENGPRIDLTEQVREDILLALPPFPHCDEDGDGGTCSATEKFQSEEEFSSENHSTDDGADAADSPSKDDWSALDQLKFEENQ